MATMFEKVQEMWMKMYMEREKEFMKAARIQELQQLVAEHEKLITQLQKVMETKGSSIDVSESLTTTKEEIMGKQDANKLEITDKLDVVKNELAEKVHTENVKCYRNVQNLIEELDGTIRSQAISMRTVKSIKRGITAAIILGVINLLAIAGYLLYEFEIIEQFL